MKVFNNGSKKTRDLFETLIPVFTVGCTNRRVDGDKGSAVYINVSAENQVLAKDVALNNEEFISHIYDKENFGHGDLVVFKPTGSYVIGKVTYYEGDPRL